MQNMSHDMCLHSLQLHFDLQKRYEKMRELMKCQRCVICAGMRKTMEIAMTSLHYTLLLCSSVSIRIEKKESSDQP